MTVVPDGATLPVGRVPVGRADILDAVCTTRFVPNQRLRKQVRHTCWIKYEDVSKMHSKAGQRVKCRRWLQARVLKVGMKWLVGGGREEGVTMAAC